MKIRRGLALTDILRELLPHLQIIEFPQHIKMFLIDRLAEVECNIANGASEKIQLGAVVSSFVSAREQLANVSA